MGRSANGVKLPNCGHTIYQFSGTAGLTEQQIFKSQNVFFEFALSCYVRYLRDLGPKDSNVSRISCVLTAATCF
jgi:hypothetical protein